MTESGTIYSINSSIMIISSICFFFFCAPTQRKKTWHPWIFYNPNPSWPLISLQILTSLSSVTWHSPAFLPTFWVSFADSSSSTGPFPQVGLFVLLFLAEACQWLLGLQRQTLCSDEPQMDVISPYPSLSCRPMNPTASLSSLPELTEMKPLPPRGMRAQNRNKGTGM